MRWPWSDDTDRSWARLGDRNPYYGVLTVDRFKGTELSEERRDEFFRTGERHTAQVLERVTALYRAPSFNGTALDFGCGVGRVSLPLARRFAKVIALDVSPGMIEEARANASIHNVRNIEFQLSTGDSFEFPGEVAFIHSYIVFQHIPAARGLAILQSLLHRLAPGGHAAIDLALTRHHSPLRAAAASAKRNVHLVHNLHNLVRGRRWSDPLMQTNVYPLTQVSALLLDLGFTDVHVDLQRKQRTIPQDKAMLYLRKPH